jgi:hypothetical protein
MAYASGRKTHCETEECLNPLHSTTVALVVINLKTWQVSLSGFTIVKITGNLSLWSV